MSVLKLEKLNKTYPDGTKAVVDFSLTVESGEFLTVVGTENAGKTTLLRVIAGLEDATSGEILMDGKSVADASPKDRDVAMIFPGDSLAPHLNVYDNLAFGLRIRKKLGQAPDERYVDRKVQAAAELLGLSDLLNRKPKMLNAWQRLRVALGRAVVRDPKLYLFDEPFTNLDETLRARMRAELCKLQARLGATFLYVTEDVQEALSLGSRVAVMKDGFLQQADTPVNLYEAPVNRFVAELIGAPQMNFFEHCILSPAGGLHAEIAGYSLPLPEETVSRLKAPLTEEKEVCVGVRPEDLHVQTEGEGVPATAESAEQSFVRCTVRKESVTAAGSAEAGAQVVLVPDAARVHLFDGAGGLTLLAPGEAYVSDARFASDAAYLPPTPAEMKAMVAPPQKKGKK